MMPTHMSKMGNILKKVRAAQEAMDLGGNRTLDLKIVQQCDGRWPESNPRPHSSFLAALWRPHPPFPPSPCPCSSKLLTWIFGCRIRHHMNAKFVLEHW